MNPLWSLSVAPPTMFETYHTSCAESYTADSGLSRPFVSRTLSKPLAGGGGVVARVCMTVSLVPMDGRFSLHAVAARVKAAVRNTGRHLAAALDRGLTKASRQVTLEMPQRARQRIELAINALTRSRRTRA